MNFKRVSKMITVRTRRYGKPFLMSCIFLVALYICIAVLTNKLTVKRKECSGCVQNLHTSKNITKPMVDKKLWIHVVEEHHEVLPYWFRAANRGKISKSATLIHIDGHSDLALNFYLDDYPYFRFPRGPREMRILMQRNDGFITAAAMAGLIDNFIWIWPKWDQVNHDLNRIQGQIHMGWTIESQSSTKLIKDFCMCMPSGGPQQECVYTSLTEGEVSMADNEACIVKASINYTEIREDLAEDYLRKMSIEQTDIILDIDEDFFGCVYASQPLFNVNIFDNHYEELDVYLRKLFCPINQESEDKLDKVLVSVLEHMTRYRCVQGNIDNRCSKASRILTTQKIFNKMRSNWIQHVCLTTETEKLNYTQEMAKILADFNMQQLKAFQEVGFCLSTNRKSYQAVNPSLFMTCAGANNPNHSVITIHETDKHEIQERGQRLLGILSQLQRQSPKIVTVCRSVRDGYTPRKYFTDIENIVLSSLQTMFRDTHINYDRYLLGGKLGFRQDKID